MKKFVQYFLALAAFVLVTVVSCTKTTEADTDQYNTNQVVLQAYGPQPVVRGGVLRFVGSNLDKVVSVTIPEDNVITDIEVVSSGVHSEIRVTVPKETAAPGLPVLTLADGTTITGKTQLTYSEPIIFDSFSPAEALPGATVTITGDYLNLIHEVIFANNQYVGEKEFVSHDRYTIKVKVPQTAQTGVIGLGTIDESAVEDENLLATLNILESEEVFVVTTAKGSLEADTYKAGDVVTIKGTNLDLTACLELEGAVVEDFTATATSLTFKLPATATDGQVNMIMASDVAVSAGSITTVVPVVSGVTPAPVKNGAVVTLAGSDLDLVTGLDFPNAAGAEFALAEGVITATVPEAAREGDITLHLANGKTVAVELTLVKPVVTAFSANPASAGSDITITGTDLDLVASVTFPGVEEAIEVETTETEIVVAVPTAAETGNIVLNLKNGATVEVETELAIDKPAGAYIASFPEDVYDPGAVFIVDIENADHLTGVQIDGVDVVYIISGATLYLQIPSEATAGSQLTLVSDNGSVTYTMNIDPGYYITKTLWQGNLDITWSDGGRVGVPVAPFNEMKVGAKLRFYYTQKDQVWAQAQINNGAWSLIDLSADGYANPLVPTDIYGWFADGILDRCTEITLTQDLLDNILANAGEYEGVMCGLIIQGSDLIFTKVEYFEDNSPGTEIWSGPLEITWSDGGRVALPAAAFQVATAGQKLRLFYTQKDQVWAQAQVNDANWSLIDLSADGYANPLVPTDIYGWFSDGVLDRCTEITLTQDLLDHLTANTTEYEGVVCSIIIQGSDLIFNKVTIK